MRALLLGMFILPTLLSCASLPRIHDPGTPAGKNHENCLSIFPEEGLQLVHSVEAVAPGGYRGLLMGVCNIDPPTRSIHCVMMTVEGFILFDGELNNGILTIKRGVPPFDSTGFARGMMEDIGFIFFKPPGSLVETGFLENSSRICRFTAGTGVRDIIRKTPGGFEIIEYDENKREQRRATAGKDMYRLTKNGFSLPSNIILEAREGYSIRMDLIEAIFLN